jgi:hypothetical protein
LNYDLSIRSHRSYIWLFNFQIIHPFFRLNDKTLLIALCSIGSFFFPGTQLSFLLFSIFRNTAHSVIFFFGKVNITFDPLFPPSQVQRLIVFKRTVSFPKTFLSIRFLNDCKYFHSFDWVACSYLHECLNRSSFI